jgi:hypothetical protein
MTEAEWALGCGLLAAFGTIAGLAGKVFAWGTRFAKVELKIDTIWDFHMRRAQSEAVKLGIATMNSPVKVSDEAKEWMAPLIAPIREFYKGLGRRMTERDLYIEIERRFGEQILREVCIPHGLSQGACLLIAVQAVRDGDPLTPTTQ